MRQNQMQYGQEFCMQISLLLRVQILADFETFCESWLCFRLNTLEC